METSFSLNEIIKYMIQNNMSLDEICNGLNFDRKYIITLLKGITVDEFWASFPFFIGNVRYLISFIKECSNFSLSDKFFLDIINPVFSIVK